MRFTWNQSSYKRLTFIRKHVRSVHNDQVRVRFAPSPTGDLHLGGLRTALYNYLFAAKNKGKFVLRIEDTDQSRLVPGATEKLMEMLHWAGITPDEGPHNGGDYGPYIQSERVHIYKEHAQKLLENGSAYRCFCSESRLQLLRKEAVRNKEIPRYDNKCRSLTQGEISENLTNKKSFVVRLKLADGPLTFNDLVSGPVTLNIAETEGDPVLLKSDGFPTYHLACVIDDHLMKISHVLRGVEWQVSTPKHLMLYRGFGWQPPEFCHLPLLLNKDGTKLSKRQGHIQVEHIKSKGYFAEAILNFIVLAGGGFGQQTGSLYSLHDLISKFSLEKVNTNSCRLEPEKMIVYNREYLIRCCDDSEQIEKMKTKLKSLVLRTLGHKVPPEVLSEEHLKNVLLNSKGRIVFLEDLVEPSMHYLWMPPKTAEIKEHPVFSVYASEFPSLCEQLSQISVEDFQKEKITSLLREYFKLKGINYSSAMQFLRFALSGLKEGPSVAEIMVGLGRKTSLDRLQSVLKSR